MSFPLRTLSCPAWILACGLALAGCGTQPAAESQPTGSATSPTNAVTQATAPGDTITIASFNIQVFGISKLNKPPVMEVLADVVRRFDVVAIQEIRAKDDTIMPRFVQLINARGAAYDFVVGPRLGRTTSKEQYAFIYDTARIALTPGSVYTVPDPQDRLHREPLVANFRVQGLPPGQGFSFSLVNIHTDPDEVPQEVDALADVFVGVQRDGSGEDDVIVLGDLNADEYRLGRFGRLPNIACAILGLPTNTRGTQTYDNLVFDAAATGEYAGRAGVLNLMAEYRLTMEQALEVSDHLPVWAVFSASESNVVGPLANRPVSQR